jgi:hypothetical protein
MCEHGRLEPSSQRLKSSKADEKNGLKCKHFMALSALNFGCILRVPQESLAQRFFSIHWKFMDFEF